MRTKDLASTRASVRWMTIRPLTRGEEDNLIPLLPTEERQRCTAFHHTADRHAYLLSHLLLRGLIAGALATHPSELRFTRGRWGRPELDPPTLRFNLSHTPRTAAVVLAHVDCGIDVERVGRVEDPCSLARFCFTAWEARRIQEAHPSLRESLFIRLWTLKEAYLKAQGLPIAGHLDSIGFRMDDDAIQAVPSQPWHFEQRRLDDETWLAVAIHAPRGAIEVSRVELDELLRDDVAKEAG